MIDSQLLVDVERLHSMRRERKELDAQINETQDRLIAVMEESGHDRMEIAAKTLVLVRPTKDFIDELGLKTEVGKSIWQVISRRTFDKRRAEVAMERGILSPLLLQKHTYPMAMKPYVRINI